MATQEPNKDNSPVTALSESFGEKLDGLDRTLWHMFTSAAKATPKADALVSMWQTEVGVETDQYIRWSYEDLYHKSSGLAQWLDNHGLQPGARVATFLWNSAEWGLFLWASARLGAVFTPLDPRIISTEAGVFLSASTPSVIVVPDAEAAHLLTPRFVHHIANNSRILIQASGEPVPGWVQLRSILSSPFGTNSDITISSGRTTPNSDALLIFTSGTTAAPKGCPHTHTSLVAQTHQYCPNREPIVDRWLVNTPVSHIFAINNAIRAWRLGNAVIFPSKTFDVTAIIRALADEQVTFMSAVPTLVKGLLAHPAFPGKERLNIKLVTIGGTIITPQDIGLCLEGLGADHAVQGYGMSEGAPVISWLRWDPLLEKSCGYHPGVGKALPGVNLRVCVPGTRDVVARGETGELHVGGPAVITEYLGGVEKDKLYVDAVGNWLVTGDQARMDEDGIVYILGRYKDLIIRGGENISPGKVELAIGEIEGVAAQVVGVPDDLAGQVAVAVVKLPEGVDKGDVLVKARELGPMYALDGVYTLEELGLDGFPVTSLGKVKKEVLRQTVIKLRAPAEPSSEGSASEGYPDTLITSTTPPESHAGGSQVGELQSEEFQPGKPSSEEWQSDKPSSEEWQSDKPSSEESQLVEHFSEDVEMTEDEIGDVEMPSVEGQAPSEQLHSWEATSPSVQLPPLDVPAPSEQLPTSDFSILDERPPSLDVPSVDGQPPLPEVSTLSEQLVGIWHELTGERPGVHDAMSKFGDSITLIRFCDRVLKACGRRIFLEDLLVHSETFAELAALIHQRPGHGIDMTPDETNTVPFNNVLPEPVPSPTWQSVREQCNHIQADSGIFQPQSWSNPGSAHSIAHVDPLATAIQAAGAIGLDPSSVESTLPIKTSYHGLATGPRPHSYHTRILFRANFSPSQIQAALEATLTTRPILRTLIAHHPASQHPFHVVLKPTPALFAQTIQHLPETADPILLAEDSTSASHTSPFTARFTIIPHSTSRTYLLATYSHSVFDALSLTSFHKDISHHLTRPGVPLPQLTPYSLYTSLYANYATSLPAQTAINHNIHRLRGISRFAAALWPPQRAPAFHIGRDDPSHPLTPARDTIRNQIWASSGGWSESKAFTRITRTVSLPSIADLSKFGAQPKDVMKAAIAIFNVLQTGERFAAFGSTYAGRKWPFVLDWMGKRLPPAGSVDGPMMEWATEFVEVVRRGETVSEFVARLVEETKEVESGLFWNAFMVDKSQLTFVASWDTAQMSASEVEGHCDTVVNILQGLVWEESWAKEVLGAFSL
ncbi:hypothetical protein OQA88_11758 [Cercophora sp. LCS_1]